MVADPEGAELPGGSDNPIDRLGSPGGGGKEAEIDFCRNILGACGVRAEVRFGKGEFWDMQGLLDEFG